MDVDQKTVKIKTSVKRKVEPFTIDVKRFYLPTTVVAKCPKCGETASRNLGDHYLSYPVVGVPERVTLWCEGLDCDEELSAYVVVRVVVEAAP